MARDEGHRWWRPRWSRPPSGAWTATLSGAGCAIMLLAVVSCGGAAPAPGAPVPAPGRPVSGVGVNQPAPQTNCAARVGDADSLRQALTGGASGGRPICVSGGLGDTRLEITVSGTPQAPVYVLGDGTVAVRGITVKADNVIVEGVNAVGADAPGISLRGTNITLRNDTSISPRGGDGDGIRFWGTNIKIVHNTIRDTRNLHGAHADCMQTFATDAGSPASQHVLIDANRCEKIANTCLIVEGPHSSAGDGSGIGQTADITFSNNYCDNKADQALQIDDVQNMTVTNNDIVGDINHAFAFQNNSTGATVSGNKLADDIKFEVGMDDSSHQGYHGPEPDGAP